MQLYNTEFISLSTPSVLLQHTSCRRIMPQVGQTSSVVKTSNLSHLPVDAFTITRTVDALHVHGTDSFGLFDHPRLRLISSKPSARKGRICIASMRSVSQLRPARLCCGAGGLACDVLGFLNMKLLSP